MHKGVSQEDIDRWNKMNKKQICKGLRELQDWIKYNTDSAWRNEHRLLSDHDHAYYQSVLKGAEDKLSPQIKYTMTSDPATGCDYGIGG